MLATLVHLSSIGSYLIALFSTTFSLLNPPKIETETLNSYLRSTNISNIDQKVTKVLELLIGGSCRVTLAVAAGFLAQILGGGGEL